LQDVADHRIPAVDGVDLRVEEEGPLERLQARAELPLPISTA
jgi:hypothetical protein